jgi:hypothetical protein
LRKKPEEKTLINHGFIKLWSLIGVRRGVKDLVAGLAIFANWSDAG